MTIPPVPVPVSVSSGTAGPSKAPSWWRRNLVALIAMVVLVPATAAAIGWQEWYQYFGFGARAFSAVEVAEGDTAELGGAIWGPVRGGVVEELTGLDVPAGTRLIGVAVPVRASTAGIGCQMPTLVEQSTGREWHSVRLEIGLPWSADEPETCISEEAGSYDLILPYVVPEDATGPFWVDVEPYGVGGEFLRFSFEP